MHSQEDVNDIMEYDLMLKGRPDSTPPIDPPGQLKKARHEIIAALLLMIEAKRQEPEPDPEPPPKPPGPVVPFFRTPIREAHLRREISEWKTTRFWRGAAGRARKGVGADCVSFVEKTMVNMGAMKPIVWPRYITWGAGDVMMELLLKTLDAIPEFRRAWSPGQEMPPLMVGDVIVRNVPLKDGSNDYHHLAIFLGDNTLVHMRRRGLNYANIKDRHAIKLLQAIYRIYEPISPSSSEGR